MTDQPDRTPYCTKIRYGITGAPTIDGDEMDGSYAPGVGLALAKWLASWDGADFDEHAAMPDDLQHALAIARQINGGQP
ncbi:hypothetical protein [Streptomyces sp. B21-083]|uniref:hypothetical protein n=1 Tax=Streptomyces sp. B21-083 TaxID=3039410 RepID=UPI002FF29234